MSRPSPEDKNQPSAVRLAKAPFDQVVLVCGKCARKLPGRGVKDIRSQLKVALKDRRWGKIRVVECRCLDLCPKRRQVLASARTLADRRLVVVDPQFDTVLALTQLLGPPWSSAATSSEVPTQASPAAVGANEAGAENLSLETAP